MITVIPIIVQYQSKLQRSMMVVCLSPAADKYLLLFADKYNNISFVKQKNFALQNIIPSKCTALDFERYITENRTFLLNDPLRDILLYPSDDVSVSYTWLY